MPTEDVDVATGRKSDGGRQTCTEERRARGVLLISLSPRDSC